MPRGVFSVAFWVTSLIFLLLLASAIPLMLLHVPECRIFPFFGLCDAFQVLLSLLLLMYALCGSV